MKVLAEIPAQGAPAARAGALRRRDLEAFDELRGQLAGARAVLAVGEPSRKRAVALGLATAAAAAGTRTVLLECALADPALADALGLAAAPGLHEYLRGEVEAGGIVEPLVLAGPGSAQAADPLVCVVAGRPAADAAPLLGSERFRRAAARLRSAYRLLVIEGPAADDGEAALKAVASAADTTLACVGRGEEPPALPLDSYGVVVLD